MTSSGFAGRVFVVAGQTPVLGPIADALTAAGGAVAVVSVELQVTDPAARFRAEPTDPQVWERVVPHVEQRLGPIDGVVTDDGCTALAEQFVGADLRRRGHGAVVAVDSRDTETGAVLRRLADTL